MHLDMYSIVHSNKNRYVTIFENAALAGFPPVDKVDYSLVTLLQMIAIVVVIR